MRNYSSFGQGYDAFSNKYNAFSNKYDSYTRALGDPITYTYRPSKSSDMLADILTRNRQAQQQIGMSKDRSLLDRTLDSLMTFNYMSAGFADGIVQNDIGKAFKQVGQGFMAGIGGVFGQGNEKHEYTYSGVLETMGWKPESGVGKFTKGTLGFIGDVLLDPTTYLTGGASALVKGTGRVGKAKTALETLGKELPALSYESRLESLISKGVSIERAEKFAYKQFWEDTARFAKPTHMTDEMAELIVRKEAREKGVQLTTDVIKTDAKMLSREYNSALGIYDIAGKAKPITFGVENMLFGSKIAPKLGPLGKTLTLSDGVAARKFGDKIGLSHTYANLRDAIYGGRIGKALSTTAPKVAWAQKDPAQLYQLVKAIDSMKGNSVDKVARRKEINNIAKAMDLSPTDQRELLDAMENATIGHKVRSILRFSETEKAKEVKKALEEERKVLSEESKTLEQHFDHLASMRKEAYQGTEIATKDYEKARNELAVAIMKVNKVADVESIPYREAITQLEREIDEVVEKRNAATHKLREEKKLVRSRELIDVNRRKNKLIKQYNEVRKSYTAKMNDVNKELAKLDSFEKESIKGLPPGVETPEDIRSYLQKTSREQQDMQRKEMERINTRINELDRNIQLLNKAEQLKGATPGKTPTSGFDWDPNVANEKHVAYINELADKFFRMNDSTDEFKSVSKVLSDELSEYVYGFKGAIVPFRDNDFANGIAKGLLKLVQEHATPAYIKESNLLRHGRVLSPHAQNVYKHINVEMGTRAVSKEAREEHMRLTKKINLHESKDAKQALDVDELDRYLSLDSLVMERKILMDKYFNMDAREFYAFREKWGAEKLAEDMKNMKEGYFDNAGDAFAGGERYMDDNSHLRGKFADDDAANPKYAKRERTNFSNAHQITDDAVRMINKMTDSLKGKDDGSWVGGLQEMLSFKGSYDDLGYTPHNAFVQRIDLLLKQYGGGTLYEDLPAKVQDVYLQAAMGHFIKGSGLGEATLKAYNRAMKQQIKKETAQRAIIDRMEHIKDNVLDGHIVKLESGETAIVASRRVTDHEVKFDVVLPDKSVKTIHPGAIKNYAKNGSYANLNLLLNDSVVKGYLGKKGDLLNELNKLTHTRYKAGFPTRLKGAEADATKALFDAVKKPLLKEQEMLEIQIMKDVENLPKSEYASKKRMEAIERLTGVRDGLNKELRSKRYYVKKNEKALSDVDNVRQTNIETLSTKLGERITELEGNLNKNVELRQALSDTLESLDMDASARNAKRIEEIEKVIANDDALEDYIRLKIGDKNMDHIMKEESGLYASLSAIDNLPLTDQQKKWGKLLRENFWKAGLDEVKIGKLKPEQFEEMAHRYVYHSATPEYEKLLAEKRDANIHVSPTQDYGYGIKWSNSSRERTAGKTISEFNEFMEKELKGKNAFSESISDIFVARMMRHEELMYDHEVTQTMMQRFATPLKAGESPEEGFKAVANFGNLKEKLISDAKASMSVEMGAIAKKARQELEEEVNNRSLAIYKKYYKENVENGPVASERHKKIMFNLIRKDQLNKTKEKELSEEFIHNIFKRHLSDAAKAYDLDPRILDDLSMPMVELTSKQSDLLSHAGLSYSMSDSIVDKANLSRKIKMQKDDHRLLQMYDKFLHWIKVNQTAVMPAFHVRNKYSNMFQSWLGVGRDAFDPRIQVDAFKTVMHRGDMEKLSTLKPLVSTDGTKVYHWNDLYDMAIAHNVIDEGFFAQDLSRMTESKGLLSKFLPSKYDPTSTKDFAPYKFATHWGSNIEGSDRLIHFASMLRQGHDVQTAAESSIKYLFDYADLTLFERSVMKRLVPYYTWIKKNSRLQIGELLEQPEKYQMVAKVHSGVENMNNREDKIAKNERPMYAQDWIQTPFTSVNRQGQKNPIFLSPNMPYMDIARMFNPFNPVDSAREAFTTTTPVLKLPIEFSLNWNAFFDDEIVEEGDSKAVGYSKHALSQLALYNAGKGAMNNDDTRQMMHIMNTLTGVKMMPINRQMAYKDMLERMYKEKDRKRRLEWFFKDTVEAIEGKALIVGDVIKGQLQHGVVSLMGQPPLRAEDYTGAMRPISKDTYDAMSHEDKQSYAPPSKNDVAVYHAEAKRLEDEHYAQTGKVKKFVWSLFDGLSRDPQKTFARVTKVADGDTFDVSIGGKSETVRLLLVDTPESVDPRRDGPEPMSVEASNFAKSMLLGKDVSLIMDDKKDKYGRTLAFVGVEDDDFNKMLIEEGYAQVRYLDQRREKKLIKEYFEAERRAHKKRLGIWEQEGYAGLGVDRGFYPGVYPN